MHPSTQAGSTPGSVARTPRQLNKLPQVQLLRWHAYHVLRTRGAEPQTLKGR